MNEPRNLPRVFVLGSSLTIQFGPYLEKELEGRFQYDRKRDTTGQRAESDLDIPQGASGGDSSMVLAYLRHRRATDPIPAEILLLSCGLHDIKTDPATGKRQVEADLFAENLQQILTECSAMKLAVAWLRITPVIDHLHNARSKSFQRFTADVDAYNSLADRIMKDAGAIVIDLHALCSTLLPDGLIDHVHYDENGRRKQAAFIAEELTKSFQSIL